MAIRVTEGIIEIRVAGINSCPLLLRADPRSKHRVFSRVIMQVGSVITQDCLDTFVENFRTALRGSGSGLRGTTITLHRMIRIPKRVMLRFGPREFDYGLYLREDLEAALELIEQNT